MRHSPRMGLTFEDPKRKSYVARRYLKREHRRANKSEAKSLKEFAQWCIRSFARIADKEAPEAKKAARLATEAANWLKAKATKQVRTVHPKRQKTKKETVKIKKPEDERKRR